MIIRFALWITYFCLCINALKRSQLPSEKERQYICRYMTMFERQGFFAEPTHNQAHPLRHCVPLSYDTLNANVLVHLRDVLQQRSGTHKENVYPYRILYMAPYEAKLLAEMFSKCISDIKQDGLEDEMNTLGTPGYQRVQMCHTRFMQQDAILPTDAMCFEMGDPIQARDTILDTLNCNTL